VSIFIAMQSRDGVR